MATILHLGGGGARAVPNIFGDGSDGAFTASSDTAWSADTEDTGMIVKNFTSLVIPAGVTVSAGNRNCGMIIRVAGDCTIAGTLRNRMSPKTLLPEDNVDFSAWPLSMLEGVAGAGGAGGAGGGEGTTAGGAGGAGMTGRFYGGGWSGGGGGAGSPNAGSGGRGGSAASITTEMADTDLFKGGAGVTHGSGNAGAAGGGGSGAAYGATVLSGAGGGSPGENGHPGDVSQSVGGYGVGGSGGAGNIGGGVVILLVGGNLTVSGAIDCTGGNGGNGARGETYGYYAYAYGAGAGGGGGGRIFVCHKGALNNTGTLDVSGGAAGTAGTGSEPATPALDGSIGTTAVKTWAEYKAEDIGTDGKGTPVISVAALPENPNPHTVYLVRAGGDAT